MKRAIAVGALAVPLLVATAAFAQRPPPVPPPGAGRIEVGEDIALAVGETKIISARDVKNYSEGASDIVDVKLTSDSQQFVIVGKKAGTTTLLLIKNDGSTVTFNITVFQRSPQVVERELAQLLEGTTGVRIHRVGARFFLEGRVPTEGDVKRVQQIAGLYPGQVESLVSLGAAGIERKILIRIDFYFAQYDKSSSYAVGIGWPASIGGANVVQSQFAYDFVSRTTTTATTTIVNQPLPRLDLASRHGWAKVFKQATVITSNGSEATFESGGEQNFSVNTGLTIGLQKIQFGAFLTVSPVFDPASRELDLKVDASVADLTAPIASNLPGRTTSKLVTSVHMKLGQSLVLSGIRTKSQTHDVNGLPILSDIPVLGLLFASHNDTADETEGAIFVVPSVVESVTKSATEMIDAALSQYATYQGEINKVKSFDHKPPPLPGPNAFPASSSSQSPALGPTLPPPPPPARR
jgi:pilus assembly protein CpaC